MDERRMTRVCPMCGSARIAHDPEGCEDCSFEGECVEIPEEELENFRRDLRKGEDK